MNPTAQLRTPCASCPYRRSVRLAFWHPKEYRNLIANDTPFGQAFGCHGDSKKPPTDRRLCAGWLLDQKRRGTPSLQLRILLFKHPKLARHYDRLRDLGAKLYSSIQEMYEANFPGGKIRPMQPKPKGRKVPQ